MLDSNSTETIFRFVQLRPVNQIETEGTFPLIGDSPFAVKLVGVPRSRCRAQAQAFLRSAGSLDKVIGTTASRKLISTADRLIEEDGTVGDLREQTTPPATSRANVREDASDFLLASKFAPVGTQDDRRALEILFKALTLISDIGSAAAGEKLAVVMARPLVMPFDIAASVPKTAAAPAARAKAAPASLRPEQVYAALREVTTLYQPGLVQVEAESPAVAGRRKPVAEPLALNEKGVARLTKETRGVLESLNLDPAGMAVHRVAAALEGVLADFPDLPVAVEAGETPALPQPPQGDPTHLAAGVRVAGVADLLVVKQHLQKYRRMDIAHVENVLIGEKKSRTHRRLEREEQTFITSSETTHEKETELQTTERFELNQETQRTIKQDQQIGFSLSLSGKYGPTVEFSSQAQAQINQSSEETTRSALTYAKDIMQRSLERVVETVRQEQIRTILREEEETNLHELENKTQEHIAGIYQFLEKVLRSQVFNYGIRTMFDFMVPEPASYLWHLEKSPATDLALPAPPPQLATYVQSANSVTGYNYRTLAAVFSAKGLEPPPAAYKTSTVAVKHGEDSGDEGGQPRSVMEKEIAVPDGYRPISAIIRPLALTDDALTLGITLGTASTVWQPTGNAITHVGSGNDLGAARLPLFITEASYPYDAQSKLLLHVVAFESNAYSVMANVVFACVDATYAAWQNKVYDALVAAQQELQLNYDQKVEDLKARAASEAANAAADFGQAPSQNLKTLSNELKKHCISIMTQQWYDGFDATVDADPPYFDLDKAAEQGAFIRFFEQAFEWDQLQYVCYPYFWARRQTWSDRFRRKEVDSVFLEFLQSGAARVVVPARPGFEEAVIHYLESGEIWNGAGDPPPINSPLYVSIVEEIKERTGAPQGEIPVGDSWETVLPTSLVILRHEDDLPQWVLQDPDTWDWEEAGNP